MAVICPRRGRLGRGPNYDVVTG